MQGLQEPAADKARWNYYKLRQVSLLQSAMDSYVKVRHGLLQVATGITKCRMDLLQVATGITKCRMDLLQIATGIKN